MFVDVRANMFVYNVHVDKYTCASLHLCMCEYVRVRELVSLRGFLRLRFCLLCGSGAQRLANLKPSLIPSSVNVGVLICAFFFSMRFHFCSCVRVYSVFPHALFRKIVWESEFVRFSALLEEI